MSSSIFDTFIKRGHKRYYVAGLVATLSFAFMAGAWYMIEYEPWIIPTILKTVSQKRRRKKPNLDIGAIFGMDVGGTLTKIVYFEKFPEIEDEDIEYEHNSHEPAHRDLRTRSLDMSDEHLPSGYKDKIYPSYLIPSSGSREGRTSPLSPQIGIGEKEDLSWRNSPTTLPLTSDSSGSASTSSSNTSKRSPLRRSATDNTLNVAAMEAKAKTDATRMKSGLSRQNSAGSLAKLNAPDHQAALKELYEYMSKSTLQERGSPVLREDGLSFFSSTLGGRLHFLHFETKNMLSAINVLSLQTSITENISTIGCTGGGAHKYAKQVQENLEIQFKQLDELQCLIRGMHFALTNVGDECYTYRKPLESIQEDEEVLPNADVTREFTERLTVPYDRKNFKFPYLVVNIGSGVSIVKVAAPGVFERISGTSIGGGTYWGLCKLLLATSNHAQKLDSYAKVLELAEQGDASKIDMLVRDIYGGAYSDIGLSGNMVASSFGKLVMKDDPQSGLNEKDLAIALLMMITNNIGQVSYLNAQLHGCNKIFFVGSFLRHNQISCRRLAFAIDFWSKSKMEALFLTHEGYFGALGTFLSSAMGEDVDEILNTYGELNESKKKESGNAENTAKRSRSMSASVPSSVPMTAQEKRTSLASLLGRMNSQDTSDDDLEISM
jgi:type II pantothenate kinase